MDDGEYNYNQAMDLVRNQAKDIYELAVKLKDKESLIADLEEKVDQLNFDIAEQDSKLQIALDTIDSMLEDKQALEAQLDSAIDAINKYSKAMELAIQEIEYLRDTKSIIGTKSIQLKGD